MDTPTKANRLIQEKSPYLYAHAHNPIDWFPWGDEAFAKAQREKKPLLVSVGYASCHWCHVMAAEAFEDPSVADLLNHHFVAVKVDREERPDVDALYMQACVALTGQGGWPLNVLVLPDRRPFYTFTYLPVESKGGMTGLRGLLSRIASLWETQPEKLASWAQQLETALAYKPAEPVRHPGTLPTRLEGMILRLEDRENGGLGGAPKFPNLPLLRFLVRRGQGRPVGDGV